MSIVLCTFVFSPAGGIVPFLNVEAYLLSVEALAPNASVWPIAIAAALGQMAAKRARCTWPAAACCARFFTLGLVGRTIRFAGVFVLPHLVQMLR